ncbi:MAG: hypothetical protein ACRECH_13345 [Nitrososphaerales archaeon]
MSSSDYLFSLCISERGLAEGKRPPLCDGCGSAFQKDKSSYLVTAFILDGERFWGLECENYEKKYLGKLPILTED